MVDVGVGPPPKSAEVTEMENRLRHELLDLIHKCTPADKSSPLAPYLPGFTSLRLLLTQQDCSHRDNELLKSVVASYESYTKGDRPETEIAAMTARDFMLLSKQFVATSTNSYVQIPAQDANATICMAPLSQQQQQYQQRQQQQQQQSLLYQMVDPDPVMAPTLTGLSGATGFGAMNCDARNNYAPSLQPLTGQQDNGNNNARSGFASLQHMFTGSQVHGQEYPLGFSPALHPIPTSRHLLPSPMNINQEQLPSLGVSPALHPITSQADGVSGLGLFGLSASQISALLQNDARNFQGL